jgi:hypothetical protein
MDGVTDGFHAVELHSGPGRTNAMETLRIVGCLSVSESNLAGRNFSWRKLPQCQLFLPGIRFSIFIICAFFIESPTLPTAPVNDV